MRLNLTQPLAPRFSKLQQGEQVFRKEGYELCIDYIYRYFYMDGYLPGTDDTQIACLRIAMMCDGSRCVAPILCTLSKLNFMFWVVRTCVFRTHVGLDKLITYNIINVEVFIVFKNMLD